MEQVVSVIRIQRKPFSFQSTPCLALHENRTFYAHPFWKASQVEPFPLLDGDPVFLRREAVIQGTEQTMDPIRQQEFAWFGGSQLPDQPFFGLQGRATQHPPDGFPE